jgi:hypothetical protein
MVLDDGERAECKEIAREIIKEVIAEHIMICPVHGALIRYKALLVGACIGGGVSGGGIVWALLHSITGII